MKLARSASKGNKCRAFYLLMICMIVVTGMCCRVEQADSLFCAVAGQTQTIVSSENITDASETCTQELIKCDQLITGVGSRIARVRTNLRVVLFFLIAGMILRFQKYILTAVVDTCEYQVPSNTAILKYIQHQDGKKR